MLLNFQSSELFVWVLFLHKSVKKTIQNRHLFAHITGESKMAEAWHGLVAPHLLQPFPFLFSGVWLSVSPCLPIFSAVFSAGRFIDKPASVVLGTCISEWRVSLLIFLTEGPMDGLWLIHMGPSVWFISQSSGQLHDLQQIDPNGLDPLLVSDPTPPLGGWWVCRGWVGRGLVHRILGTEQDY